jgi:hypothetical protein
MYYILQGRIPVVCDDIEKWADWNENNNRQIALTKIGPITISTVFLGLNHNLGPGLPLVFETCIFSEDDSNVAARYTRWADAVTGHEASTHRARMNWEMAGRIAHYELARFK